MHSSGEEAARRKMNLQIGVLFDHAMVALLFVARFLPAVAARPMVRSGATLRLFAWQVMASSWRFDYFLSARLGVTLPLITRERLRVVCTGGK